MKRIQNILKEKCPKCESGDVFLKKGNVFMLKMPEMNETCSNCGHRFEIEPGYFVGAMYISYALTLAQCVGVYLIASVFNLSLSTTLIMVTVAVILMSFVNLRYSRIIWMHLFTRKTI